jgi:hypothetical protein
LSLTEINLPHVTAHTHQAIQNMTRGEAASLFWTIVLAGIALPTVLAAWTAAGGPTFLAGIAGVLALAGLALYEDCYIRAGQSVPQS